MATVECFEAHDVRIDSVQNGYILWAGGKTWVFKTMKATCKFLEENIKLINRN